MRERQALKKNQSKRKLSELSSSQEDYYYDYKLAHGINKLASTLAV